MALALALTAALWAPLSSPLAAQPPLEGATEVEVAPDSQAIYGGETVEPGAWPAVVAVRTDKLCTGTLVAPNLVLTAAHCFDPAPSGSVDISFGDSISAPSALIEAEAWGSHEDFCLPSECGDEIHDFAWVRLPEAVEVDPIVPITDQDEFDAAMGVGTELVFVGYGQDEDGIIGQKQQVDAAITSYTENGREFRAGGDGKDTCYGDSGGPALVQLEDGQWRLAGVLSRGGDCGEGGVYGVPLPELCWLRDESGVDLLPSGCEQCDCVILSNELDDEGCECGVEGDAGERSPWRLALAPICLLGGLVLRRRMARGASVPRAMTASDERSRRG
ncbi:trypsin-like serine protease [Pseudenhygromyxa sp. WMMC2535]|uniref:S1 family peptidase n=1 Tax=Pseudenhygromyxa sp. WMMC2535 TaxID=2712867 RepID=UPI0015573ABF|nr:trypsin-like serine protease [Pseudenhygromyxa sp. WMMC2535]NVB40446.1 trypsin-like serine protease [Pseudenhygromyxa sp. WMMC2535]